MIIVAAIALAMDQVPFIGLEQDRKTFEPYRQCVLAAAKQQYPTGKTLKAIFENAQKACVAEQATAQAEMALNAAGRTIEAMGRTDGDPGQPEYRFGMFDDELLYEIANDFVPKGK
jgi:hypothetical protein